MQISDDSPTKLTEVPQQQLASLALLARPQDCGLGILRPAPACSLGGPCASPMRELRWFRPAYGHAEVREGRGRSEATQGKYGCSNLL